MKQYVVEVREVLKKSVPVMAESAEAAIELVSDQYVDGEIILGYDDYFGENSIVIKEHAEISALIEACRGFLQIAGFDYLTKMMYPTEDQMKNTEQNGEALDLVMELQAVVKEVADRLEIESHTEMVFKEFVEEKAYILRDQLESEEEFISRYEDGLLEEEIAEEDVAATLSNIEAIEEKLELLAEMEQYVARKVKESK